MTKKEALAKGWELANKYPSKASRILSKLNDTYGVSVDEYNEYDRTILSDNQVDILEARAEKLKDIKGFSQVDNISDVEILRVFESRDDLAEVRDNIPRPPVEAEWYKAGLDAEERIGKLRPYYETKMAEEWEQLGSPAIYSGIMGPIQFLTELGAGWTDYMNDFGENLHERGMFTSPNPLTGFGAWEIAEFQRNKETGEMGFSSEIEVMERELNDLYGDKREYESRMVEGGYRDVHSINQELEVLNQIIMENRLLDPRILGETQ